MTWICSPYWPLFLSCQSLAITILWAYRIPHHQHTHTLSHTHTHAHAHTHTQTHTHTHTHTHTQTIVHRKNQSAVQGNSLHSARSRKQSGDENATSLREEERGEEGRRG